MIMKMLIMVIMMMIMVMIMINHDDNCEFPDGSNPSMSVKLHCRRKTILSNSASREVEFM